MKEIVVVPYNPDWVQAFKLIENELLQIIKDSIITIEHVGSTSVPDLYAKPIIDIDIVIDQMMFEVVKIQLKKIGYIHKGDLGIVGREAFGYENKEHLMKHHLYVCDVNSDELKRHLALRSFLLCNQDYREKYSIIKLEMAKC